MMKASLRFFYLALHLWAIPIFAQEALPPVPDLTEAKEQVRAYYHSGRYEADISVVTLKAQSYVMEKLQNNTQGKLAIVLDIDETTLSNWPYEDRLDFAYDPAKWKEWTFWGAAAPIRPTLSLYQFAQAHGIHVFFISGRKESERTATEKNLKEVGFTNWAGLYLRPDNDKRSAVPYKSEIRKSLVEQGYVILANLGDQQSDLDGGYAEQTFKLPNPFYRVN